MLKEASVHSNQLWKAAGKPRQGPIFHKRQTTRMQYRRGKLIKEGQRMNDEVYTNEFHEVLLRKDGSVSWKCVGAPSLSLVVNALKQMVQ